MVSIILNKLIIYSNIIVTKNQNSKKNKKIEIEVKYLKIIYKNKLF